jgi:predicted transcriptional regulator
MSDSSSQPHVLAIAAQIVSAHVAYNALTADTLPALIVSVYSTLASVGMSTPSAEKPKPAVPVKRSVFPDHIVCLEDGKKLVMPKRHLRTAYAMTPAQYRERWGLLRDSPMIAPNYAVRRFEIARTIGLGRKRSDRDKLAA